MHRNGWDCFDIVRNILTDNPISAGQCLYKAPVAINQGHGKSVNFQLHHIACVWHHFPHTLVKGMQILQIEGIAQTQHGALMLHLRECIQYDTANALRNGIGVAVLWEFILQCHQLLIIAVIFLIAFTWLIQYVIFVRQPVQYTS